MKLSHNKFNNHVKFQFTNLRNSH